MYTANENDLDGSILFLFVCTRALTNLYLTLSQALSVFQSPGFLSKAEENEKESEIKDVALFNSWEHYECCLH